MTIKKLIVALLSWVSLFIVLWYSKHQLYKAMDVSEEYTPPNMVVARYANGKPRYNWYSRYDRYRKNES